MTEVAQREAVLAANAAFYDAFRSGDFAAMDALWSRTERVSVYHPGWPGIEGRDNVMQSWGRVIVESPPPPIFCEDETVILNGRKAIVFCVEAFDDTRIVASNIFVLEDDAWRLVHHQATHIPVTASDSKATE